PSWCCARWSPALFSQCHPTPRPVSPFPTRRSSDLADHQRLAAIARHRVEDRLDEILDVVLLLEDRHLLAKAGGPWLLVCVRCCFYYLDHPLLLRCQSAEELGVFRRACIP